MHEMDDDTRREILGEALMDELKTIREYVADLPAMRSDLTELKADVMELKEDVQVIRAVVTNHSQKIRDLDERLGGEQRAA